MKNITRIFNNTLFRYGLVGGSVSLLDVVLYNVLIYVGGTYYVLAAVISNVISFFIRFYFQKHYAFRSPSKKDVQRELFQYGILFAVGVALTAFLVYVGGDILHLDKSLSQIIAILLTACVCFFVYRYTIFPVEKKPTRKLLIVAQKVDRNDPVLGFFHKWVEEFSKKYESVVVICLEKGESSLPDNVKVLSLGKEERQSRLQYLIHFYWYILYERNNYDGVFVHMNQQYIILGSVIWKLLHKKIYMWRNHVAGSLMTKVAVRLCDTVFCTSEFSYTARYKKTLLMPVGIDTNLFQKMPEVVHVPRSILFLARIAPIKKPDLLCDALIRLHEKKVQFSASFYGDPTPQDAAFYTSVKEKAEQGGISSKVNFHSGVPNYETVRIYNANDVSLNLTPSGSYDKTIFEAMACETLILASNRSLYGHIREDFIFKENDVTDLTLKLEKILKLKPEDKNERGKELRRVVVENHSLEKLMNELSRHIA